MTETSVNSFPPMHPVTRMGRIIQQLRSFGDLHATELETMADTLETAGAPDVAAQLRAYRAVQRDEADMVVSELVDIQTDMIGATEAPEMGAAVTSSHDPAANSPRRAKWLAEQAAEAERLRQPVSRRELFGRAAAKTEDS